ncbi:LacI family DNA-binding transcriptional regulator [Microlunatus soli]|uniref:Transcriptional regulator, LacI family n=1 Tax=Microlunatus soli TaxID=630515 RepID=A0A1H1RZP2_9ACTN|nr:LacI family DNA-binding transcriptional regulator [Microlunatus soli]SDS41133.1 transcriptional regulator, LacI family [Microlunatus soli]
MPGPRATTRPHATIKDVAAAVGMSPATVSRALARPDMVASSTAERIRQVADELGYSPSPQARWLHTGRSNALTLVLPDITNPFFFDLIRGAQHEAARAGYTQVLVDTEESAAQERSHLAAARKTSDGAVLGGSRLPDTMLGELAARFPLVSVNRRIRGVPSVTIDTPAALAQAVDHLAGLGHRRIAYLGGPESAWFDDRRWQAIRAAADDHGLTCSRLGHRAPTMIAGEEAVEGVTAGDLTAVITYNDLQALGLMRGLERRGIAVPDQFSIIGCDDIFGADLTKPTLTTVTGSAELAGELATKALLERLDTGKPPRKLHQTAPAHLTIRDSTAPPPEVARR